MLLLTTYFYICISRYASDFISMLCDIKKKKEDIQKKNTKPSVIQANRKTYYIYFYYIYCACTCIQKNKFVFLIQLNENWLCWKYFFWFRTKWNFIWLLPQHTYKLLNINIIEIQFEPIFLKQFLKSNFLSFRYL